jgi:4-diphosphocytidyl-2-C-methyl-D-erythritol kinase
MIEEFAPAKINLALHVLGRRADGYHEIDSMVAFAAVGDKLTLELAAQTVLSVNGAFAAAVPTTPDNLVLKAYAALNAVQTLQPVSFHLTKTLPVASGIGGGSADAAAALRGLIRMQNIKLDTGTLQKVALSLGADVPVCLHGKACRMRGVGEQISDLESATPHAILLVNPKQACSTTDVFRSMGLKPGDRAGSELNPLHPSQWRNDMTEAACQVLPVIRDVLHALGQMPECRAVRMSGSGATCFATFDAVEHAKAAREMMQATYPQWWSAAARLGSLPLQSMGSCDAEIHRLQK